MKLPDLLPSDLGERFRVVIGGTLSIPIVVAVAFALSGAPGRTPDAGRLWRELQNLKTWQVLPVVGLVLLLGVVVAPAQFAVVRLLEGYWGSSRAASWLAEMGVRHHQQRRGSLEDGKQLSVKDGREPSPRDYARVDHCAERLRSRYPAPDDLLPTALGNALRAAERRAGDRYGLDAIVLWPRLYMVMASAPRQLIDSARDQIDMLVMLSMSLAVTSVVTLVYVASHGWWLVVPPLLLLLALCAYRGAVTSAVSYGVLVQVAYDLYRFDLLTALHIPLPSDSRVEGNVYDQLQKVLEGSNVKAKLPEFLYSHPGAGTSDPAEPRRRGTGDRPASRPSSSDPTAKWPPGSGGGAAPVH